MYKKIFSFLFGEPEKQLPVNSSKNSSNEQGYPDWIEQLAPSLEVGVLFDIDAFRDEMHYGRASWKIICQSVKPADLENCRFFCGDVRIPVGQRSYGWMIGIKNHPVERGNPNPIKHFARCMWDASHPKLILKDKRLVRGQLSNDLQLIT